MAQDKGYLDQSGNQVVAIVKNLDRDVERGEDTLMLGYGLVLLAPAFAPLLPPSILLPLMAITFAVSATVARLHFYKMARKLSVSLAELESRDKHTFKPITDVFDEHPQQTLAVAFNPLKNLKRTWKSILGGLMINPFWGPIFYMLGVQFVEDKQLVVLNKAVIQVEDKVMPIVLRDDWSE
ncbi:MULTISPECIES: hypothetical protein [Methylomonas]|uniref:Uncharacterized protein n=2 Tax=Methylomonas TaxID=416 RepID=A0A140E454_9GAMM|nr:MULTISPECIES: hypothetical protein [Methylomonas]AMK75178.1 hypothetical protein JT25_001540 [Methylomonas denitrificans]OAH99423.1 hypothetical protein A1342_04675 [Methylomonas methanica]TCV85075.1 hypothetical protein EDE11_106186 [Methylomonas methanica]